MNCHAAFVYTIKIFYDLWMNRSRYSLIRLFSDIPTCGTGSFRCPSNARHCIGNRYLCDGVPDCTNSEDESAAQCGAGDPCQGKVIQPSIDI